MRLFQNWNMYYTNITSNANPWTVLLSLDMIHPYILHPVELVHLPYDGLWLNNSGNNVMNKNRLIIMWLMSRISDNKSTLSQITLSHSMLTFPHRWPEFRNSTAKHLQYSISQKICTRFCCALLCCGYAIVHNEFIWSIYPYSSGLLCWHRGNR